MSTSILVVEDTASLRALIHLCMERAGYTVELAEDGRSAVEKFIAGSHDAVIMDIQMPVMDGLSAVARMREHEKAQNRAPVPILALTANTEPSDLRKYIEAGFTGTIRKPFGREDLVATVKKELGALSQSPAEGDQILITADPEFADLIPTFLDNCRLENEAMKKALERRDYPAIVVASHKLLGAGASYGFELLSDKSRLIEAAAKAADAAKVSTHLEEVRRYLERVRVSYP